MKVAEAETQLCCGSLATVDCIVQTQVPELLAGEFVECIHRNIVDWCIAEVQQPLDFRWNQISCCVDGWIRSLRRWNSPRNISAVLLLLGRYWSSMMKTGEVVVDVMPRGFGGG